MSKHAKLLMTHTRRTFHSQRHDTVRNMSLWGPWRRSENHNEFWIWESVFLSIVEVSFAVLEFLQKLEHLKWRRDTPSNTRACTHPSHQAVFPLRHTVHIKQQAHDSFVNVAAHSSSSLFILSTITLLCWNTLTEQRSQRYVLQCSGFFSIFFFYFDTILLTWRDQTCWNWVQNVICKGGMTAYFRSAGVGGVCQFVDFNEN